MRFTKYLELKNDIEISKFIQLYVRDYHNYTIRYVDINADKCYIELVQPDFMIEKVIFDKNEVTYIAKGGINIIDFAKKILTYEELMFKTLIA